MCGGVVVVEGLDAATPGARPATLSEGVLNLPWSLAFESGAYEQDRQARMVGHGALGGQVQVFCTSAYAPPRGAAKKTASKEAAF